MTVVYSSVNLVSIRRGFSKYLLVVPFLVAIAFGSFKVGHSSGAQEMNVGDADSISQKREVVDVLQTEEKRVKRQVESYGGAVYTRWGRNVCASGSDVVYTGVAGGSLNGHTGGGSNYLCLPKDPIWGVSNDAEIKHSKIYGAEYENPTYSFGLNNNDGRPLLDNNVPCVVCRSQTMTSVVMIPARNQCYAGWTTEYTGYLMSARSSHLARTEFVCMDGEPESDPSGYRDENSSLFFMVEGICGSLPCPPYVDGREITCAVCTK